VVLTFEMKTSGGRDTDRVPVKMTHWVNNQDTRRKWEINSLLDVN